MRKLGLFGTIGIASKKSLRLFIEKSFLIKDKKESTFMRKLLILPLIRLQMMKFMTIC